MKRPSFESASGLRPATAFVGVAAVLVLVVARAFALVEAERARAEKPSRTASRALPAPDFDLVDRNGRELAMSVQRMDLCLSPRAMWQAHTPRHMAEQLAGFLVDEHGAPMTPDALLDVFLPTSEERPGWISLSHPRGGEGGWRLDFAMASRVRAWTRELGIEDGFQLVREGDRPVWELWWCPELVLSEARRDASDGDPAEHVSAWEWGRTLAEGLGRALWPDLEVFRKTTNWEEREQQHARMWRALMPVADAVVSRGVRPGVVPEILKVLDRESVRPHQMRVDFEHERVYPTRGDEAGEAAFALLGDWRHLSNAEATAQALELVPADDEASEARRDRTRRELLERKFPLNGLEGVSATLLEGDAFAYIAPQRASYDFLRNRTAIHGSRRYYVGEAREGRTPVVRSTLDAELQTFLHESLVGARRENDAALAMGIVVDVATGDVLAVDGVSEPATWEFLPTWHLFTPGSTFKVVVMATALDAHQVSWGDDFDTFDGNYRIPGSSRVIHEARGAPVGHIPAWKALAYSVNAVMVQIGMKVDDDYFADKLRRLGYEARPGSGVGAEREGDVPDLPWKGPQSHASVCFGHELSVSLWQHAAALATIARGGEFLPLRLVDAVEWNGEVRELPLPERPDRVFAPETCETVREMMRMGALEGTGKRLYQAELDLGTPIELRSKTGTTEKKPSEPCLHLELARNANNLGKHKGEPGFETFKQMMQRQLNEGAPHSRACYTSSICLLGRVPGEERELMALVVVEEPRGKGKFGSDVAGPTAVALLKEGLGLTRHGLPLSRFTDDARDYGYEDARATALADHPWAQRAGAEQ
ncbi:MAG: hypothetical protein H6828_03750 [Planctomycetes bacterium]|nr:hypothetical protein [Planctomycetota bacterium]